MRIGDLVAVREDRVGDFVAPLREFFEGGVVGEVTKGETQSPNKILVRWGPERVMEMSPDKLFLVAERDTGVPRAWVAIYLKGVVYFAGSALFANTLLGVSSTLGMVSASLIGALLYRGYSETWPWEDL